MRKHRRRGYDLLHDFSRGVQINEALVDAHLKAIPGLATLTARCLTGSDLEVLGGEAYRSPDSELLCLGSTNEISTHFTTH
jgi:hypothetical protein